LYNYVKILYNICFLIHKKNCLISEAVFNKNINNL
jgi:hypothetical protein